MSTIDFVAYNDSAAGPQTHANTTLYRGFNGVAAGLLKNVATGAVTGVTLTTLSSGVGYQNNGAYPAAGTDAASIFGGFVDLGLQVQNSMELSAVEGDSYTYQFTGLATPSRYGFTGTGVRGEPSYTNRWTLVTLIGAESFTAAHSSGVGVVTAGLAPNQVAVWTGTNHQAGQGFVAQWTDIDAGADGQFDVVATQYTGATPGVGPGVANGAKGYVIEGIRLIQYTAVTAPAVVNTPASDVESFTASARGTVTDTGNENPAVTVFYGTSDGGTNAGTWSNSVVLGTQAGDFSAALSGLNANTTYFYRARANNSAGESWAPSTASFITRTLSQPAATTNPAENVQAFNAFLGGQVTNTGGDPPDVTLFYGTSDGGTSPASWTSSISLGEKTGGFSALVDGLSHSTTYFFRARSANAAGTTWTAARSFATLPVTAPTIVNTAATNVAPFSASIGGNVTNIGGDAPLVTIFYGTTDGGSNPAAWTHSIDLGETFGAYAEAISNLSENTTYFFRSRAVNAAGTVWASPSLSFTTPVAPTVRISEFMASNSTYTTRIRTTPTGTFGAPFAPDWIEVQNLTSQPINLGGYSLTDNSGDLDKWVIPAGITIAANGFMVFFASDENIKNPALDERGFLHTNFKLGGEGEYLAIVKPNGQVAHAYAPQFPEQSQNISYGLNASGAEVYFSTATPGASNSAGVINFVEDTKFSVDRGFFDAPIDVAITTDTPGASIRYTLDSSAPTTTTGTLYTGPIHITKTTALRAIAYNTGFVASDSDTQTYIFLSDVVQQTAGTTTASGFPATWNGTAPDYGLDPDVIGPGDKFGGLYVNEIRDSLLAVPTLSIVGNINEIFGASGIYSNPTNDTLEITVSAELIMPDGGEGFQINSGLKIQGGAFRNFSLSKKKSFRLKFSEPHGPTKLDYPFFGDDAHDSLDTITLRMEANDGWQWAGAGGQPQYARDEFMRQSMLDAGNPAPHGERMHLYINGVYWGVYNPVERPDGSFAAAYFGGEQEEWDVQNSGVAVDGNLTSWNTLLSLSAAVQNAATPEAKRAAYQQMLGNNADGSDNPALESYLDVDNYIDYLIVNWYGGNSDWPSHNYYMGRRRGPESDGFVFFMWDAEWTLFMQTDINTNRLGAIQGPTVPYSRLTTSEDFKLAFADRVQKAFFEPGGAFYVDPANPAWDPAHPERNEPAARFVEITEELPMPLIAESARWGDQHRTTDPYTVEDEWRTENNRIISQWFPQRSNVMINQFKAAGLYPSFNAPAYRVNGAAKHGGVITTTDTITLTAPAGTIYYTLDGSDPRKPDGTLAANAITYTGGFQIGEAKHLAARLKTATGAWSALSETQFYVNPLARAGDLVVTELMYNPPAPTAAELAAQAALDPAFDPGNPNTSHYEFIELMNVSGQAINLDGARFKQVGIDNDGIEFTFPNVVIAPGQRFVVSANPAAFQARYGTSVTPVGTFKADLSNGGELITIVDADNQTLLAFEFNDTGGWPGRADGGGSSLELVNLAGDLNDSDNWRASSEYLGTPGVAGLGPDNRVVINEVLSHTDLPLKDAIELVNTTAGPIDIGGWYLSDSTGNLKKFRIPNGTTLLPGQYIVFDEDDFNPGQGSLPTDFSFNAAAGDSAYLMQTDTGTGALQRFVDSVSFGAQANAESWGRFPNLTGDLTPLLARSLGSANGAPRIGPVIISEVMYQPVDPGNLPAGVTVNDLEFVEIFNPTGSAVSLTEWRIRGGVDYDFGPTPAIGPSLAAQQALVIVSFDPADPLNAAKLTAFRSHYGIGAGVPLVGPFGGNLDNSGESVRLERPDEPPNDDPDFFPRLLEDDVNYDDLAPWPVAAAGGGDSLNRRLPPPFGSLSTSFTAADPTPGSHISTDTTPPTVAAVYVRGSTWLAPFTTFLGTAGLGDMGYALPVGAAQLATLPWTNVNTLIVRFSEDVAVQQSDLALWGVNTPEAALTGFDYDSATFTATWTLAANLTADKWLIDLSDSVEDLAGNALDGDWGTGAAALPSGDSAPGGAFQFRFNVLPGNADQSGNVLGNDVILVRNAQFQAPGSAGYRAAYDIDGSGSILGNDVVLVRNRQFTSLPAGEPGAPQQLAVSSTEVTAPLTSDAAMLAAASQSMTSTKKWRPATVASIWSRLRPLTIHLPRQIGKPS